MLITYSYRTYPRTQPVWSIGRSERDRLARSRYRRMAAGPVRNISRMQFKNTSDITLQTDTNRHDNGGELHAKLMSSDRAGFETRCLRGQAAAAGPGRGAGGRRRGLAGQHTDTPTDWRPPRGLRGLAGLRADAPSEARGADGERAGRPRGGRRSVGGTSDNRRIYSPARRSTSCMMRPHAALTHATAATPRTRDRQGRTCRKSSKP